MARYPCSRIILAGGSAVPHKLAALLGTRCDDTILIAADPLCHLSFNGLILSGSGRRHYPYGAIYKGLSAASHPHALVVDGRSLHVATGMLHCLLDAVAPRWDLVIPETEPEAVPPMAVLSKRCLKPMALHLDRAVFRAAALCAKLNTLVIPETMVAERVGHGMDDFG